MPTDLLSMKYRFDEALKALTFHEGIPAALLDGAINYALFSGGKRIRPLLVLSYADFLEPGSFKKALPAALAVEMIHTYSLIHDDLPSMDNDDYRRGRLSTHRQFDEATAILAGDALIADAFYVLSSAPIAAHMQCQELARAAGRRGLVSGQIHDLQSQSEKKSLATWLMINQAKTGHLFAASAALGALSVGASKKAVLEARTFGALFGESFQIKDDIDDHQGLCSVASQDELSERLKHNVDALKIRLDDTSLLARLVALTF